MTRLLNALLLLAALFAGVFGFVLAYVLCGNGACNQ